VVAPGSATPLLVSKPVFTRDVHFLHGRADQIRICRHAGPHAMTVLS
jgi:hypothetical protein